SEPRILDAGCGTGEVASRLAQLLPRARVLGVDIIDPHLQLARSRYATLAPRLTFEHQSVFGLDAADRSFDLTVCRHVIHAIPHPDLVIGRNTFGILARMGLEAITMDYVVVDTLRVPREIFAAILEAWRDGYAEPIGELTPISRQSALAYFEQMIANVRDPYGYAVW